MRNLISNIVLLTLLIPLDSICQDNIDEFRKSFYSSFFKNDLDAKKITTIKYTIPSRTYKGDSLETPINYELQGQSNFELRTISMEFSFINVIQPNDLIKTDCYYQYIQNTSKYSQYYDTITDYWKTVNQNLVDSLIKKDMAHFSEQAENEICIYYKKMKNDKTYFLISEKYCVQLKIKVANKSGKRFLKKHNYNINKYDLITKLLNTGGLEYWDYYSNQNLEFTNSKNMYELIKK